MRLPAVAASASVSYVNLRPLLLDTWLEALRL